MTLENTAANRMIKNVANTMAVEDMYVDEEFINEMSCVAKGEKTSKDIINKIKREYGR